MYESNPYMPYYKDALYLKGVKRSATVSTFSTAHILMYTECRKRDETKTNPQKLIRKNNFSKIRISQLFSAFERKFILLLSSIH